MYLFQEIHVNDEPSHITFYSSYCNFHPKYIIGVLDFKTKILKLKPTQSKRNLKLQEKIKQDYPGYKLVEWTA